MFNQLVYGLINLVIAQVTSLRDRLCSTHGNRGGEGAESEWSAGHPQPSPNEDEPLNVERDSAEEEDGGGEGASSAENQNQTLNQSCESRPSGSEGSAEECGPDLFSSWSTEEREKLLLCAAKIFQIQFPLYTAYKHNTHPTIEVHTHTHTLL